MQLLLLARRGLIEDIQVLLIEEVIKLKSFPILNCFEININDVLKFNVSVHKLDTGATLKHEFNKIARGSESRFHISNIN